MARVSINNDITIYGVAARMEESSEPAESEDLAADESSTPDADADADAADTPVVEESVTDSEVLASDTPMTISIEDNKGDQNYHWGDSIAQDFNWASPVETYLVPTDDGYMAVGLMENGKQIRANYYDADYNLLSSQTTDMELPLFGGFFAGSDAYYVICGQENPREDDSVEVVRIIKYDTGWNRLGSASLYGANTTIPFGFGSLRVTEKDGYLYIVTCHQMYMSKDGLNHQANMLIEVRTSDMTIRNANYKVAYDYSYVSHSFNQFVITDENGQVVQADHGDAHPRAVKLTRYKKAAGSSFDSSKYEAVEVFPFSGTSGDNFTGATLGGLEYSSTHYLIAGSSTMQLDNSASTRNIFVTATSKTNFSANGSTTYWITDYPEGSASPSTPQLVKMGANSFLLMWDYNGQLNYVFLDGTGKTTSSVCVKDAALSDCKPTVEDGKATWFVSDGVDTKFYSVNADGTLDDDGNKAPDTAPTSGTFGENNALSWTISEDNVLTISGKGTLIYTGKAPWDAYKDRIQKIAIVRNVNAIGERVFAGMTALKDVSIAESVSSIGANAFAGCTNLVAVGVPDSVAYIGDNAFTGCSQLQRILILNPKCKFSSDGKTKVFPDDIIISGQKGSTAEEYAKALGYNFSVETGITLPEQKDGWQKFADQWYYFVDGESLKNMWVMSTRGIWYFMDENGVMVTGVYDCPEVKGSYSEKTGKFDTKTVWPGGLYFFELTGSAPGRVRGGKWYTDPVYGDVYPHGDHDGYYGMVEWSTKTGGVNYKN